ncbi:MAG: IS1595 family transposase [Phycisphaerales bacterium]|nr:IS1595 family transposase [Hyphomonadaceae bacterium]
MEKFYTDDEAARAHLESLLWPDGPICPRCGVINEATLMQGKSHRPGLYNCRPCDKPFTVTVGTIYERSHIPLHKWVYATHLMTASKKGISAAQLHRMLGFGSYRTAWFMAHRIREAMKGSSGTAPLGGEGQVIEADESYYGKQESPPTLRSDGTPFKTRKYKRQTNMYGSSQKRPIVVLVERGGKARTFHVAEANRETVEKILAANASTDSRLHTDESHLYKRMGKRFAEHASVNHSKDEYARGDVTSNSAEGFFNVFKRGMTGVYQHCGEAYLNRYLVEFEFRHNTRTKLGVNDKERAGLAHKGAAGKRLTLRRPAHSQPSV